MWQSAGLDTGSPRLASLNLQCQPVRPGLGVRAGSIHRHRTTIVGCGHDCVSFHAATAKEKFTMTILFVILIQAWAMAVALVLLAWG